MMNKIRKTIRHSQKYLTVMGVGVLLGLPYHSAKAELDARVTALGTVALYGAGAGALIGLATLAFGKKPRAVAQGASLGLYAGILFGSYIVVTHHMKKTQGTTPVFPASPYEEGDEESRYDEYPGANITTPNALEIDRYAGLGDFSVRKSLREQVNPLQDLRLPLLEVSVTF
jgi:hypothetical protein